MDVEEAKYLRLLLRPRLRLGAVRVYGRSLLNPWQVVRFSCMRSPAGATMCAVFPLGEEGDKDYAELLKAGWRPYFEFVTGIGILGSAADQVVIENPALALALGARRGSAMDARRFLELLEELEAGRREAEKRGRALTSQL